MMSPNENDDFICLNQDLARSHCGLSSPLSLQVLGQRRTKLSFSFVLSWVDYEDAKMHLLSASKVPNYQSYQYGIISRPESDLQRYMDTRYTRYTAFYKGKRYVIKLLLLVCILRMYFCTLYFYTIINNIYNIQYLPTYTSAIL